MVKIILLAALEQSNHFKMTADFMKLLLKRVKEQNKSQINLYAVLQYLPEESDNRTKVLVRHGTNAKENNDIFAALKYYADNFKFISFDTSIYPLLTKLNDIEIIPGDIVYVIVIDFRKSGGCFVGGEKNYFINEIIDKVSKDAYDQPLSNVHSSVRLIYSENSNVFCGYSGIENMRNTDNQELQVEYILPKVVNFEMMKDSDIREWVDFVLGNN